MNNRSILTALIYISLLLAVSSCEISNNDDQQPEENKYLVQKNLLISCNQIFAKGLLGLIEEWYPEAAGLSEKVKYGYSVYKIEYNTKFKNQDIVASGLACIPKSAGPFPLLSFQNGTNTLHASAPSVAYADTFFLFIEAVSSFGFIIAIPDYPGFGASQSMYHPYLVKEPTVQTIIDMYRAIEEMMSDLPSLSLLKDLYLMGYSQGGWATMALKEEIETNLTDEFTLKATACGAGPYDLTLISKKILEQTNYPMPYFMAYLADSYIRSGETDLTYSDIFKPAFSGNNYIPDLFDGTKSPDYINSQLSTRVSDLFTEDMISNFSTGNKYESLRLALKKNSVTAWKTISHTFLVHGLEDDLVTPTVSENIYLDFLAKGTNADIVKYTPIPEMDHGEAVIPWGLMSLKWILTIKE